MNPESVSFSVIRLTDGHIKVHLTNGDGTGYTALMSVAQLREVAAVCRVVARGTADWAEVGPCTG